MGEKICVSLQLGPDNTLHLSQKDWILGRKDNFLAATARAEEEKLLPLAQEVAGTLSKTHARIRYAAGGIFIEDMHSANGVFLNGLPLRPLHPAPLAPGDRLRLGALQLTVALMPCQE